MKYDLEELLKENMNIQETPSQELKERILYQEEEGMSMRDKRKYIKFVPKAAVVAVAVVLATGGIAYAGTSLWNHYVAEDFGVAKNESLKKDMEEKGFVQQPQEEKNNQVSVSDQDITVTVQQTLADERSAYVSFEVKYGDQYQPVDEGVTEDSEYGMAVPEVDFAMDYGKDTEYGLAYGGPKYKVIDDHTIQCGYFVSITDDFTFKDGKIKMSISAFKMNEKDMFDNPKYVAKDGKWDLVWNLSVGTEKRVYHLDHTLTLGEDKVVLKDLTITPLSTELTMENPDGVSLSEIGAVLKDPKGKGYRDKIGDLEVIRYVRTGGMEHEDEVIKKLPKGQSLCPLDTYDLCLDGKDFDGMGGSSGVGEDYLNAQFDKVLDLDKVTGVRVAEEYIDLKDVSYETVK